MIPKLAHRTFKQVVLKGIQKKGLKTVNEKAAFAIQALETFASKKEAVPVVVETWETMSKSKASEAIGEENFALANVRDMVEIIDYNCISDEKLAKDYFDGMVKAVSRIYNYGLMFGIERYSVSHFSASGRGRGEGIFVKHAHEASIMHLVNHWEWEFAEKETVTSWWKIKMNVASNQKRISSVIKDVNGNVASDAKIAMKNILFVKGIERHTFHINDVREVGWFKAEDSRYSEVSNPVNDGCGWIDIDAVEQIYGVRLEKADIQGRGWDIKYTAEIGQYFKVLSEDLGGADKFIQNYLTGELIPIKELADRGYCMILPAENIKFKTLRKHPEQFPNYPMGLDDDELWVCASVGESDSLKMHIRDSRQMLVPLQGISREEVENLINIERIDKLMSESLYEDMDEFIPGFSKTTAVKKRHQDLYRSERHELEFGRFEENGCYPFCSWEAIPQMADLILDENGNHVYDYHDFRSLRGLKAIIGCVPTKTALISRFPNIERHFIYVKNMANFNEGDNKWLEIEKSLHCRNTLVLGIDLPATDLLKLDCDGDTPKTEYPKSVEEDEYILANYDWDMLYIPTAVTSKNVSFEEFAKIQAAEKTVSTATMRRLSKLNH